MLAGVGTADITPPVGVPLQGHWSPRPESKGVLYPLEVRTLALRNDDTTVVLVTADLLSLPLDVTRRIRTEITRRHGIPGDHVAVVSSHTHCGPATLQNLGLVPDLSILRQIEDAIVDSVAEALDRLEPVTLGIGCGSAHFNVNRRPFPGTTPMAVSHSAVVDHRVRLLRLDRATGDPLAILFHFSCHPTAKSGADGWISPDYPGVARAYIERELRAKALFLPGCFGNIRPLILNEQGAFGSATKEQLDAIGESLGVSVVEAARYTRTFPDDRLAAIERDLLLPFGSPPPREELERMAALTTPVGTALYAPWARRALEGRPVPDGEHSVMQAIRIGPVELITIPGEPVQEIGHGIERELATANVWPVGYTNDQVGYLCTPRMYDEGGYEPTAYVVFDRPAPFNGEQRAIVEGALRLHRELNTNERKREGSSWQVNSKSV